MAYLGRTELKSSDIRLKASTTISGSSTNTVVLTWTAPTEQSIILKVNGVVQHTDAYSIAGSPTTITLASGNFADGATVEVVGINDIGTTIVPADGSVTSLKLADDSVTAAKLDTTGTPTGAKFLQDDMAWTTVDSLPSQTSQSGKFLTTNGSAASWATTGGKVLQVSETSLNTSVSTTSTSYVASGLSITMTGIASTDSKFLLQLSGGSQGAASITVSTTFYVDGSEVSTAGPYESCILWAYQDRVPHSAMCLHSPSTTSDTTYAVFYKTSSGTGYFNDGPRVVFTVTELSS